MPSSLVQWFGVVVLACEETCTQHSMVVVWCLSRSHDWSIKQPCLLIDVSWSWMHVTDCIDYPIQPRQITRPRFIIVLSKTGLPFKYSTIVFSIYRSCIHIIYYYTYTPSLSFFAAALLHHLICSASCVNWQHYYYAPGLLDLCIPMHPHDILLYTS